MVPVGGVDALEGDVDLDGTGAHRREEALVQDLLDVGATLGTAGIRARVLPLDEL